MLMKTCTKCGNSKNFECFHNDKRRKDGKYPNCKECHNSYVRNRYHNVAGIREDYLLKHKEKLKNDKNFSEKMRNNSKKFYASLHGRARTIFANALKSSKQKNMQFTLTLEHVIEGMRNSTCPVTGIEFQFDDEYILKSGRRKNPYSPSIDRIDATKGYTNENTRIVIWQYNMMKGELTDYEVRLICEKVINNA